MGRYQDGAMYLHKTVGVMFGCRAIRQNRGLFFVFLLFCHSVGYPLMKLAGDLVQDFEPTKSQDDDEPVDGFDSR
jgi:hypothetical protein